MRGIATNALSAYCPNKRGWLRRLTADFRTPMAGSITTAFSPLEALYPGPATVLISPVGIDTDIARWLIIKEPLRPNIGDIGDTALAASRRQLRADGVPG